MLGTGKGNKTQWWDINLTLNLCIQLQLKKKLGAENCGFSSCENLNFEAFKSFCCFA